MLKMDLLTFLDLIRETLIIVYYFVISFIYIERIFLNYNLYQFYGQTDIPLMQIRFVFLKTNADSINPHII